MSFVSWMGVIGLLLLSMALVSAYLKRLPVSTSMVYLALGVALGPLGSRVLNYNAIGISNWLERVSEVVVLVSLFVGGLKLRLPPTDRAWSAAYRLAGPVMVLTIAGVALVGRYLLGLDAAAAVLLGAILAPTDPVLAGEVSVSDSSDRDRLRYGLSGEAGLNDGTAFPFVAFGLLLVEQGGLGGWVGSWALERVVWAVPGGLALGYLLGQLVGRLAIAVRSRTRDSAAPSDFIALALIGLAYSGAEFLRAWGFLAVFAAGVGLRHAEVAAVRTAPTLPPEAMELEAHDPSKLEEGETPAEALVERPLSDEALGHPAVASGAVVSEVLTFGETLERLMAVFVVVLVGVLVGVHFDWRGVLVAAALLLVVRPAAVWLCLAGSPTSFGQRALIAWFGIRGIGSLYYLSYAIGEGIGRDRAEDLSSIVLTVVAISVLVHGVSVTPLLARYERGLGRKEPAPASD